MKKEIIITINPSVKTDKSVHRETRQMVLKNFPEFKPEDLYDVSYLSCGLRHKVEENEKYMLLLSTIKDHGVTLNYMVADKATGKILLNIDVQDFDSPSLRLNNDTVVVTLNNVSSDWKVGNYEFLDPKTYTTRLLNEQPAYVKSIVSDTPLGFSTTYNQVNITDYIGKSVDEIRTLPKYDSHKIYCSIHL